MSEQEWGREEGFRRDDEHQAKREEVLRSEHTADDSEDLGLRPKTLKEFVGQSELKEHLGIILEAARAREQTPDHLLFAGPPGLGKTTLAGIVASELGVAIHVTSGPAIERAGDLAAILTNLNDRDVLFIDEIHRLPKQVEEVLYPAMEDFQLDVILGKGPAARSIRFDLPPFTLVGATTRTGRAADILDVSIDDEGAVEIAGRSRGTPRIANRLLRRVRDYAEVRADGRVNAEVAKEGLRIFGVDEIGLDKVDRAILEAITVLHEGGPVGLSTLSISVGEQPETVEDVYEPFLIQQGLLQRTPRGRVATRAAFAHLGLPIPERGSTGPSLFD